MDTISPFKLELKSYWDSYTKGYASFDNNASQFCYTLLQMLKFQEADSIFDAGCGPGSLVTYVLQNKKSTAKLVCMDISEEMLKFLANRVKHFIDQNLRISVNDQIDQMNNEEVFHKLNFELQVGDLENLTKVPDDEFNIYYSNMVLHLTENPKKQLTEAYRVLKKGGRIGASVWGRPENSDFFTFFGRVFRELGIEKQSTKHDFFYLKDRNIVIKMFEEAGFENIICWYQNASYNIVDYKDMVINPENKKLIESQTEEMKLRIFEKMKEIVKEKIEVKKEPFQLECVMVIATKK